VAPIETGRTPRASLAMEAVDLYATPGSYDADKVFLYERAKRPRALGECRILIDVCR
jgi:hypothetical protein